MAKKKHTKAKNAPAVKAKQNLKADSALLDDLRQLIVDARQQTAQVVNTALTLTKWEVGDRIRREILNKTAGRVRSTDLCDIVTRFGRGVWPRVHAEKPVEDASVCGGFSRPRDCRDTVATFELEPFRRATAPQGPAPAGVLCGNVPRRAVERPHAPRKDQWHVVRADRLVQKARGTG